MDLNSLDLSKINPWQVPAAQPPPGVRPNFVNPDSLGDETTIFSIIFTVFMLVFVMLRMYTKIVIAKQFGWEDFFCALGTALSIAWVGLIISIFKAGLGPHQWNVPIAAVLNDQTIRIMQAVFVIYGFVITSARLSILILYFRLFKIYRFLYILIHVGIWGNVLFLIVPSAYFFAKCAKPTALEYLQCAPSLTEVTLYTSVFYFISDLYTLLIPILAVRKLQMSTRRKLSVLAVFSAGIVACAAAFAGLIVRIEQRKHLDDASWWLAPLYITTILENHIALIVSCLPILPKLWKHARASAAYSSWSSRMGFKSMSLRSPDEKNSAPKRMEAMDGWHHMPSLVKLSSEDGMHA